MKHIWKPVAAAIFGVAAIGGVAVTPADPVSAVCYGTGNPSSSNAGWGYEDAQAATCDALTDYNGLFQDLAVDGYQVRIRTRWIEGSSSWVPSGLTNGANTNYYYGYWDSDSSTEKKICKRKISDGSEICANQGVNYGF